MEGWGWGSCSLGTGCRSPGSTVPPPNRGRWLRLPAGRLWCVGHYTAPWNSLWNSVFHSASSLKLWKTAWWGCLQDSAETTAESSLWQKNCTSEYSWLPPGESGLKGSAPPSPLSPLLGKRETNTNDVSGESWIQFPDLWTISGNTHEDVGPSERSGSAHLPSLPSCTLGQPRLTANLDPQKPQQGFPPPLHDSLLSYWGTFAPTLEGVESWVQRNFLLTVKIFQFYWNSPVLLRTSHIWALSFT